MIVIGLTGGIASGKTVAAERLAELGATVIDADRLGHRVYEPGSPGFEKVVNEFGHDIVAEDGEINRQVLGGKVFGAPDQMKRLTDIAWPEIRSMAQEQFAMEREKGTGIVVLEAAVLIEADWIDLVDEVWVLTVKGDIARDRLMARNRLNEEQAQSRIDAQISNRDRLEYADVKIDNSGSREQFEKRITTQWNKLRRRIAAPAVKQ